jgi:hypothetical protein
VSIENIRAYTPGLTITAAQIEDAVSDKERTTAIEQRFAALRGKTGRGLLDFAPSQVRAVPGPVLCMSEQGLHATRSAQNCLIKYFACLIKVVIP